MASAKAAVVPSAERLRELLHYDPETGLFTLRANTCRGRWKAGRVVGHNDSKGYQQVLVDGRLYLAHRLVWLYLHGYWPMEIDHINHVRDDNRLSNLREVTRQQNQINRSPLYLPASGFIGVTRASNTTFRARILDRHLGCFKTPEEASAVREAAAHQEMSRQDRAMEERYGSRS